MADKNIPPEPKAEAAPRIVMVKTVNPIQFLGVNGSQLAVTQAGGLEFKKVTEGISVTRKESPGKRYVVYAANIAHVEYEE